MDGKKTKVSTDESYCGDSWDTSEQKREDVFEEIIFNSNKTNLSDLRDVGWNGIPDRFRCHAWQLLLNYLPKTVSTRTKTLRKKRIEYHQIMTKHFFEFDFCLTDRKLHQICQENQTNGKKIRIHFNDNQDSRSDDSTAQPYPKSTEPVQTYQNLDYGVPPLFDSRESFSIDKQKDREDSLLLQIRFDISKMVDVPTRSKKAQHLPKKKGIRQFFSKKTDNHQSPCTFADFLTQTSTTTNRLFAQPRIKVLIERVTYLWSIQVDEEERKPARGGESRYTSVVIDLLCPLIICFIYNYFWGMHISNMKRIICDENKNDEANILKGHDEDLCLLVGRGMVEHKERQLMIKEYQELKYGRGLEKIPDEILDEIEADVYWCLCNLIDGIRDYDRYDITVLSSMKTRSGCLYNTDDRGSQLLLILMDKVLHRVDPKLHQYLKSHGVEYLWFAFHWMNCLHVRTLNEKCLLRVWDTCLCEEDKKGGKVNIWSNRNSLGSKKPHRQILRLSGFHSFQVYICSALLHFIRDSLFHRTFEEILIILRNLPSKSWEVEDIAVVLSQAFAWKEIFRESEGHILLSATPIYGEQIFTDWISICHWPPRKDLSKPKEPLKKQP